MYFKKLTPDCNSYANGNKGVVIKLFVDKVKICDDSPENWDEITQAEYEEICAEVDNYARQGTHPAHAPR